jgi:hypothetical protein
MPAEDRNKPKDTPSKVRVDDFVAKAVPDPRNVGETLFLSGFVGASSQPEHTRIYSDASLSSYVDVNTSDIVHSEALSEEQSRLGGSYIWLKRDAEVYFGASGQSTKGKFLQGPVTAAYGAQFGAAAAPELFRPIPTQQCTYGPPQCPPTAYLNCNYSNHPWCYAEAAVGGAGQFGAAAAAAEAPIVPATGYCRSRLCPPRGPLPQVAEAAAAGEAAIQGPVQSHGCPRSWYPGHCPPPPPLPQVAAAGGAAGPDAIRITPPHITLNCVTLLCTTNCATIPCSYFGCGAGQFGAAAAVGQANPAAQVAGGYPYTVYFCSMYCNPYGTHHTICGCLL